MKYFLKKEVIYDINGKTDFPLEYPVFFKFTDEEKDEINRLFFEASKLGLSADYRKICATNVCKEGMTIREVLTTMQQADEVPKEIYDIYASVPHRPPVQILKNVLEKFIELVQNKRESEGQDVAVALAEYINKHVRADGHWARKTEEETCP
jgi:hypothetical protein